MLSSIMNLNNAFKHISLQYVVVMIKDKSLLKVQVKLAIHTTFNVTRSVVTLAKYNTFRF